MFEKLFEAVQARCTKEYIKDELDNLNAEIGKRVAYSKMSNKMSGAVEHDDNVDVKASWSNAIIR